MSMLDLTRSVEDLLFTGYRFLKETTGEESEEGHSEFGVHITYEGE